MPLTPDELARLPEGADPADYIPLDVDPYLSDRHLITGATMQAGNGQPIEVVVLTLLLPVPLAYLVHSDVLDAEGKKRSPVDGMLGALSARLVLPRRCVVPGVLAILDPEEARRAARDKQIVENARLAELVPALVKAAQRVVDGHGTEYDMEDLEAALEALDPKTAVPLPRLRALAGGRDVDADREATYAATIEDGVFGNGPPSEGVLRLFASDVATTEPDATVADEPSGLTDINATRIWKEKE